jgi:hypothetical protein
MRPTFRKLEVKDISSLERLIAENVEGVEPGLKVVDSRLLLGQAAIDLIGLDGKGSLVLIALDFTADDGLLLRVMDAYSWCLEYPDALRRLYPMAQDFSRPPRILFVVEKMTDAFLRRVKQLSFLAIDCFEFRHLEVNGASVVYFDLVERLRKSVAGSTVDVPAPSPVAAAWAVEPRVEPPAEPRIEPRAESRGELRIEPRVEPRVERQIEPLVQSRIEPATPAIERPIPEAESREPLSEPKRIDPPKALVTEPIRFEPAVAVVAAPEPPAPVVVAPSVPAPVVEEASAVVEAQAEPVVEYQSLKLEAAVAAAPEPEPAAMMPPEPALALESIESTSRPHTNGHAPAPVAPAVEPAPSMPAPIEEPIAAPAVAELAPAVVAPVAAPAPVVAAEPAPAPVQAPPVWAKPGSQPNAPRPNFFASATKSTTPIEAPAMVAAVASTAEPATQPAASKVGLEVDDRPELESLSFPKDGLSRQWLEFLSQLGATK